MRKFVALLTLGWSVCAFCETAKVAPADLPWLYSKPWSGAQIAPVDKLSVREYEALVTCATLKNDDCLNVLLLSLYPHLFKTPRDARFAKLKERLYAKDLVRHAIELRGMVPVVKSLPVEVLREHAALVFKMPTLYDVTDDVVLKMQEGYRELAVLFVDGREPGDACLPRVAPQWRGDREIVLKALAKTPEEFGDLSPELREDPIIAAQAVKFLPWFFQELPLPLRKHEAIRQALKESPQAEIAKLASAAPPKRDRKFTGAQIAMGARGQFHGDEIAWKDGEKVWALRHGPSGWRLSGDRVGVEVTRDIVVDNDGDPPTGKVVTLSDADGGGERVLLSGPFEAGAVHAAPYSPARCLPKKLKTKETCVFLFGETEYRLTATMTEKHDVEEGEGRPRYDLVISDGKHTQTIEAVGSIEFVGDLDRDGKPDFLVDVGSHYNVMASKVLYLSAPAGEGEMLREVAMFRSVGC